MALYFVWLFISSQQGGLSLLLGGNRGREDGLLPSPQLCLHFPCQGLSGAQPFLSPLYPLGEMLSDIPVGFAKEGPNESKGHPPKGGWKEGRKVSREERPVQTVLFELWETSPPSLSLGALKTSRAPKYT